MSVGSCTLAITEFVLVDYSQTPEAISLTIQEKNIQGTQYVVEDEPEEIV